MRLIDADALMKRMCAQCNIEMADAPCEPADCFVRAVIMDCHTIDAVPVDAVAQMLFDLFGDGCPCNYNDIAEWLAGSNGCTENCDKNEDPLLCWKLFIKHYGERESDE